MKRKSLISLLLVMAMVLSVFAGCGKQETPTKEEASTSTPAQTETKTEEKTEQTTTEPLATEPPTKITVACTAVQQTDPVAWYETDVWKEIWKKANVEIEYIQYATDLFNLMLTSGDAPDLVISTVGDKIDDVVKSGLPVNLDDYADLAPNLFSETYAQRNDLVRKMKGGDEEALYFVALGMGKECARGAVDVIRGYSLRWDWYKEIGAPEITSSDEYLDVIEQILALHPTTEDGQTVYGMGLYDEISQWYMRAAFEEPVLLSPWLIWGCQYMVGIDDAEIVNGYTNLERSAYWTDMKFYNQAYKRGLLDPDSFTQTSDERTTKTKAGRYVTVQPTPDTNLNTQMRETDPNSIAGHMRIPTENYLVFADKKMLTGHFPSYSMWVSSKSKNIEACMRVIDVVHDLDVQRMIGSGIEGIHWNYVNGVPTLTEETIALLAESGDAKKISGIGLNALCGHILQPSFDHPDGYPLALPDTDEMRALTLTPIQKDFSEYYEVSYPSQYAAKFVEEGKAVDMSNDSTQLIAAYMPSRPTDISRIIEKINDILYRAIPDLVMAKDDAEFAAVQAQVLKDLEDVGEAQAWDWVKTEYEKAKAEVRPIFEECTW